MATVEGCSICKRATGIYFCTGCKRYFCKKDFLKHRETLNNELYGYIEDCNALREKMPKPELKKDIRSPLLVQIDEWEKITLEKVEQAAEQARQQVTQILHSKRSGISSEFEKFSQSLIRLKETEDFAEDHLKKLKQTISRLNRDMKQFSQSPVIELHMEESQKIAWNRLIYAVDMTNHSDDPHHQHHQHREMGEFIT